jgi:hypothetical protein
MCVGCAIAPASTLPMNSHSINSIFLHNSRIIVIPRLSPEISSRFFFFFYCLPRLLLSTTSVEVMNGRDVYGGYESRDVIPTRQRTLERIPKNNRRVLWLCRLDMDHGSRPPMNFPLASLEFQTCAPNSLWLLISSLAVKTESIRNMGRDAKRCKEKIRKKRKCVTSSKRPSRWCCERTRSVSTRWERVELIVVLL